MAKILIQKMFTYMKLPGLPLAASLAVGIVGIVGLPANLTGSVPPLGMTPAIAQAEITPEEIIQYARSVLEIDSYRTEAYTEIKDLLLTVDVNIAEVSVSCADTQGISQIPRTVRRQVRERLIGYCNQAQDVVAVNGLSPRRFNQITSAHRENPILSERIQQELIRIQQVP